MKTVKVELTIDQWTLEGLVHALGDLAEVDWNEFGAYIGLLPETRASIASGGLKDTCQHLYDIQEQSRNQ